MGQKQINPSVRHFENLHVGQWVAITDLSEQKNKFADFSMMVFGRQSRERLDGLPLQIVAMSFPFICLSDGYVRFAVDSREVRVTTLHPTYVREMRRGRRVIPLQQSSSSQPLIRIEEPVAKEKKSNRNVCPVCEGPLVMKARVGDPLMLTCDECGFRGGRGEDAGC